MSMPKRLFPLQQAIYSAVRPLIRMQIMILWKNRKNLLFVRKETLKEQCDPAPLTSDDSGPAGTFSGDQGPPGDGS